MDPPVHAQVFFNAETLCAIFTLEGLLPRVRPVVSSETCRHRERLAADVALIGIFAGLFTFNLYGICRSHRYRKIRTADY